MAAPTRRPDSSLVETRSSTDAHAGAELAAVLRQVPALVWTTDRDLRFTSVHGALAQRVDATRVIGLLVADFFASPESAASSAHRIALGGETAEYRDVAFARTWAVSVEPLRAAGAEIVGCVSVALDTTLLERRESELVEARQRLQALAENVPLTVYTATLDGNPRPRYISGRIEELLGVPAREFTFDLLRAALHPDDRASVTRARDEADRAGAPLRIEYRLVGRDGRTRWVEDSSTTVTIAGEQLAQGYLLDISDRKATELYLNGRVATRKRLAEMGRSAVEGTPVDVLVREALAVLADGIDATMGVYFEAAGGKLVCRATFGKSGKGRYPSPSGPAGIATATGRTFVSNDLSDEERGPELRRNDIHSSVASPVVVAGAVHAVVAVHSGRRDAFDESDVSLVEQIANLLAAAVAREQAAGAAREVERRLVHTERLEAVGQLAAGVAHDFNNLLTAISGYTELARSHVSGRGDGHLEQVLHAADRARELTAQLLAFSRKQLLEPQHVDANELVEGIVPILRPLLRERIDLRLALSEERSTVFADPARLENVVVNLAVNARDAMPGGGVLTIATGRVSLDAAEAAEHDVVAGAYATFSLTDTGSGMSREVLEKVFEPFFTTKQLGEGTGLGLSSVYGSVRQSGGFVRVASELGVGTEFVVALPVSSTAWVPCTPAEDASEIRCGASARVLVVEDEPAVRDVVVSWLTEIGYRTSGVPSAEIALAELETELYDLVLSDAMLAGLSGVELAGRLRGIAPQTRFLLMSGYASEYVVRGESPGGPVLQKPFTLAALAAAVEERLAA
jgi:PAS domain S-box-containing protein